MRSKDIIATLDALAGFGIEHMDDEKRQMYSLPPAERSQQKLEEAERVVQDPTEFVKQKFHTKPQFKHLGKDFMNNVASLIVSDPEKFFASGLYRVRSMAKFLNNSDAGYRNVVLAGVRRVINKLNQELDEEYAKYILTELKLHRIMVNDPVMNGLMKHLKYALEFSGLDTDDPEVSAELNKLNKRAENIIKSLVSLANRLDKLGYYELADEVDQMMTSPLSDEQNDEENVEEILGLLQSAGYDISKLIQPVQGKIGVLL